MHPVQLSRYTVLTPPLEALVNVIVEWIECGVSGALVPGSSLSGKTTAIQFLKKNLHRWLKYSIVILSCEVYGSTKAIDEKKLFGDLLVSMKKRRIGKGDADKDQVVSHLVSAGAKSPMRTVVLLCDESQVLDEGAFEMLKALTNQLWTLHEIRILWIFFGQPELDSFDTNYVNSGAPQLVGRFMCDKHTHTKLEGLKDFKASVRCYDETLRHPSDVGAFFTEHFATEAYAAGYRLVNDADLIWEAFLEAKTEAGISSSDGITMKSFILMMNYLLEHELPKLGPKDRLNSEAVTRAVRARNLMIHERHAQLIDAVGSANH